MKLISVDGNPFENDVSIEEPLIEETLVKTELPVPQKSLKYSTVAVEGNPFEDEAPAVELIPVEGNPFGPFREEYKGIDSDVASAMIQSREEPEALEEAKAPEESEYMTIYRGNTPRRVLRSEYLKESENKIESIKGFGRDLLRTTYSIPRGIVDLTAGGLTKSLTGLDISQLEPRERENFINKITNAAIKQTTPALSLIDWQDKTIVNPETGLVRLPETIAGMGVQLTAYAASATKITKGLELLHKGVKFVPTITPVVGSWSRTASIVKQGAGEYVATTLVKNPRLSKGVAVLAGFEVASQVMFDPEQTLSTVLSNEIPEEAEGFFKWARETGEILASNPEDSELVKRAKMGIENSVLTAAFAAVIKLPTVAKYIVGKNPSKMSVDEQTTALLLAMKEEDQILKMQDPDQLLLVKETPEGLAQVERQRDSFLSRMNQKYFTSRGYSTPLMMHAKNNAEYAQKSIITDAQFVAEQLNRAIKSAGEDKGLSTKVFNLLETDVNEILALDLNKQASAMVKEYKVPKEVATQVLEFRRLQDNLSERILKMDGFSNEAKEVITNNLGSYVRRTYRAYEDPSYKPSAQIMKDAEKYYFDKIQAQALADDIVITPKNIRIKAKAEIKKLLKNDNEIVDYVAQVNRVASLKKKKDISPEIRALLGEITDPSEKLVLSIAKLTRVAEMQQYYNVVNQLSKGSKGYVQGKENVERGLTVQIKGTNSILDSKWTTPEVERAILNKESSYDAIQADNFLASGWRTFIGLKGFGQSQATVFNHVTHARNAIGSASFLVANGHVGLGLKGSLKAADVLENKIFGLRESIGRKTKLYTVDEKALSSYYSEMQGFGIIGNSVDVNQFREMLATGFRGSDSVFQETMAGSSKTMKVVKKAYRKPRDIYSGTDDFSKIIAYENELDTLVKAYPDASLDLVKKSAALKVRRTLPTYDAIPMGIKQLRDVPLGNFISFPSEVIRTTFNIVQLASKEINSPNAVLKRRGQARLLGFVTATMGYKGLAKMSQNTFDMSDQEIEDRRVLKAGEFSAGHDLIYSKDKEGNYYTTNTQYLNSYYFAQEPALAFFDEINNGILKGKELDTIMLGAIGAGIKSITDPFTTESMVLVPWIDMATAALSEDNEDRRGRQLFPDKASSLDNFSTVITEALKPLIPGSLKNLSKLKDSFDDKPNKWTGYFRDPEYAKLEQLGIKKDLYMADEYLKFATLDYVVQSTQNRKDSVNLESTAEQMQEDFFKVNAAEYQYQQDLWVKASAYSRLFSPEATLELLVKNGVPLFKAENILYSKFKPIKSSRNPLKYRVEALSKQPIEVQNKFREEMDRAEILINEAYQEMELLSLTKLDNFKFKPDTDKRLKFDKKINDSFLDSNPPLTPKEREESGLMPLATGGEISEPVANAPTEPDERINKLTGVPYNEEAGAAYMDADDPLRALNMAAGGRVKKSAGGELLKMFIKKTAPVVAKSVKIADEVVEQADEYLANSASKTTQRANTVGTATKASNYLDEMGAEGRSLDYGAGKGLNAQANKIDDTFEPFPEEAFSPTFVSPKEVPENIYGKVISTNVINVLPPKLRKEAVTKIGNSLKSGGKALIQTWDAGAAREGMASKKATVVDDEPLAFTTSTGSYQKGFTNKELKQYVTETLGEGFEVSAVPSKKDISGVSVMITRKLQRLEKNCGGKVLDTLRRNRT